MLRVAVCFALLIVIFSAVSPAQTPDTATLRGQVSDPTHAAVTGVEIKLKHARTALERGASTDAAGRFAIAGLPVGSYVVSAHKEGFRDISHQLTLVGGSTANLRLELSVSQVQTQVIVTGVAGEVRSDEPQLGDRLGPQQVDETPLLNRRIT